MKVQQLEAPMPELPHNMHEQQVVAQPQQADLASHVSPTPWVVKSTTCNVITTFFCVCFFLFPENLTAGELELTLLSSMRLLYLFPTKMTVILLLALLHIDSMNRLSH